MVSFFPEIVVRWPPLSQTSSSKKGIGSLDSPSIGLDWIELLNHKQIIVFFCRLLSQIIGTSEKETTKFPSMEEIALPKKRKTSSKPKNSPMQFQGHIGIQQGQGSSRKMKAPRQNLKKEVSPLQQQQQHSAERSNSDSLPDSSSGGNEYRALRRKYLLLEEESFTLGTALREVENEVGTLEDEKFALLDQLVVLEGLIDPSEIQTQGMQ